MNLESNFIYACCQTGAEAALKKEIAREHPELRFAYSRPGFVTFKRVDGAAIAPGFELRSVFARAYGVSCGKSAGDASAIAEFARARAGDSAIVHVWERDQHIPGDEPLGFVVGAWASACARELAASAPSLKLQGLPDPGDTVVDVICVDEREWWYGYHTHAAARPPWPGGRPEVKMPAESPSRAYVKLEEAIRWSGAQLRGGDIAVEIGSAPGGASFNLIQRGVRVVGIDPGAMDPRVLASPDFKHIRRPVAQVLREELPTNVEWLLLDMNVEPRVSLFAVDRLATRVSDTLLGMFLTVKLNQWRIAEEIPSMLEHVRAMGMVRVRATQLPSNRQEIMIHGLTKRGLSRQEPKA